MIRRILLYFLIFLGTFLIYKNVYPDPRNWYDHYLYQAKSFIAGRVDIPDLPPYFQDKVVMDGKTYTPFPPMPPLVLIPFLKIDPDITQQYVSIFVGAINAVLAFILFKKFTSEKNAFLLTIFFAFGTVAFWSAIVGTTWYFAHNLALGFSLLSLIFHRERKDFLAGLFFSFAVLSRYPTLLGIVFYLLELYKDRKRLVQFLAGAFLCIPVQFYWDYIRFGSIFETGYTQVYRDYIGTKYPFTFVQLLNPEAKYFGYIDPRNIPLHLFSFLFYPPVVTESLLIKPSPYGMGILFTSPLLLIALKPVLKNPFQRNVFLGALSIALIDFMHYSQGWVQFGYRFVMDFMAFLLILLAIRFKTIPKYLFLLIASVLVSTWGALWGIKLGW